jgi:hypothetical protein
MLRGATAWLGTPRHYSLLPERLTNVIFDCEVDGPFPDLPGLSGNDRSLTSSGGQARGMMQRGSVVVQAEAVVTIPAGSGRVGLRIGMLHEDGCDWVLVLGLVKDADGKPGGCSAKWPCGPCGPCGRVAVWPCACPGSRSVGQCQSQCFSQCQCQYQYHRSAMPVTCLASTSVPHLGSVSDQMPARCCLFAALCCVVWFSHSTTLQCY